MEPKIFRMLVSIKNKKNYDVVSVLYLVGPKNPFPTWNIDPAGYLLKRSFHVFLDDRYKICCMIIWQVRVTSRVNISCREWVFLANQRYRRLTTSYFFIFDRKQHPKNIWFHGCWNHPWLRFFNAFNSGQMFPKILQILFFCCFLLCAQNLGVVCNFLIFNILQTKGINSRFTQYDSNTICAPS